MVVMAIPVIPMARAITVTIVTIHAGITTATASTVIGTTIIANQNGGGSELDVT